MAERNAETNSKNEITARSDSTTAARPSRFDIFSEIMRTASTIITAAVALVGAIFLYYEHDDRVKARMVRAWTLLQNAYEAQQKQAAQFGQRVLNMNFGAIEALQSLHGDGAELKGVNLTHLYLVGVSLPGANLQGADLLGAVLDEADLKGANLEGANFQSVKLRAAELQGANLKNADFVFADLEGADLKHANLKGANLSQASLKGATLGRVRFWIPPS